MRFQIDDVAAYIQTRRELPATLPTRIITNSSFLMGKPAAPCAAKSAGGNVIKFGERLKAHLDNQGEPKI